MRFIRSGADHQGVPQASRMRAGLTALKHAESVTNDSELSPGGVQIITAAQRIVMLVNPIVKDEDNLVKGTSYCWGEELAEDLNGVAKAAGLRFWKKRGSFRWRVLYSSCRRAAATVTRLG